MQANPVYDDAPLEIRDYFAERVAACLAAGIAPARIAVDPGIGFGKNDRHNLACCASWRCSMSSACPAARRVAQELHRPAQPRRGRRRSAWPGSLAAGLAGLDQGAQILRVHDVAETRQALADLAGPGAYHGYHDRHERDVSSPP